MQKYHKYSLYILILTLALLAIVTLSAPTIIYHLSNKIYFYSKSTINSLELQDFQWKYKSASIDGLMSITYRDLDIYAVKYFESEKRNVPLNIHIPTIRIGYFIWQNFPLFLKADNIKIYKSWHNKNDANLLIESDNIKIAVPFNFIKVKESLGNINHALLAIRNNQAIKMPFDFYGKLSYLQNKERLTIELASKWDESNKESTYQLNFSDTNNSKQILENLIEKSLVRIGSYNFDIARLRRVLLLYVDKYKLLNNPELINKMINLNTDKISLEDKQYIQKALNDISSSTHDEEAIKILERLALKYSSLIN